MTTGRRLNKWPIVATIGKVTIKILASATIWCTIGSYIGWHIGNDGGFKRGVHLTSNLAIELMKPDKDDQDIVVYPRSDWNP